ncbi:MAG: oligopeptide/dipeptide ABC transporter ATP-binding protein [Planctomycetota bacterium]
MIQPAATLPSDVLLAVTGLSKHFHVHKALTRRVTGTVKAVDDVSFDIRRGECLGLVGESGSGKTTTGRCILRAIEPTAGELLWNDADGAVDLLALDRKELRRFRRHMQMIFQDPYSSLNPRMTVTEIIGEPLLVHGIARGNALKQRVRQLMRQVGLDERYLNRYPHAFSGGQRQRIGIARALALHPQLVVADESVSALDVSMQAQILNLLEDLKREFHLTYLFIAHDLSVIRHFCTRVAVMYAGRLVEVADTKALFAKPLHPYAEALLSAAPKPDPRTKMKRILLTGEVPDPADVPPGCAFHPRCRYAQDVCRTQRPPLRNLSDARSVSCHFAEQLNLAGVV